MVVGNGPWETSFNEVHLSGTILLEHPDGPFRKPRFTVKDVLDAGERSWDSGMPEIPHVFCWWIMKL